MEDIDQSVKKIIFYEKKYSSPSGDKCYGMGNALKKYLNIPHFIPLKVEMDHGVYLSDYPSQSQLKTNLPIFVTRESQKIELLKYSKNSYIMGSPFVHYRKLHEINISSSAQGTVCFPVHSTHLIDVIFDWKKYAEELLVLPDYLQPVTVCMYWKDLLENRHQPLINKGIKVVTAGHMSDPEFTGNFYQILREHKYSTSNTVSSCTFYSIEMDIPFFLYGDSPSFNNFGGDCNRPFGVYGAAEQSEFYEILSCPTIRNNEIQLSSELKRICNQKLGIEDNINKRELRKVIFFSLIKYYLLFALYQRLKFFLKHSINQTFVNYLMIKIFSLGFSCINYIYLTRHNLHEENKIFTHLTQSEKVLLHQEVQKIGQYKPGKIISVEIGSFLGASSCFICNAMPEQSKLYCIDTWGNHAMKYCQEDTEEERDTYEEFKVNVNRYKAKIVEIRKWSTEAIHDLRQMESNIDFLFIDGNHSYESVKKDWELYSPLLYVNSVVAFHDTGWSEGVKQVIAELVLSRTQKIAELPNIQFFKIVR